MQHFHRSLQGDIKLSRALYEECIKEDINYDVIEDLLKQGANPLGVFNIGNRDNKEPFWADIVYGEVLDYYGLHELEETDDYTKTEKIDDDRAYNITKLFLKYGMKIIKEAFHNHHPFII